MKCNSWFNKQVRVNMIHKLAVNALGTTCTTIIVFFFAPQGFWFLSREKKTEQNTRHVFINMWAGVNSFSKDCSFLISLSPSLFLKLFVRYIWCCLFLVSAYARHFFPTMTNPQFNKIVSDIRNVLRQTEKGYFKNRSSKK